LENILISKKAFFDENTGKLYNCFVKLIDFGLAETFDPIQNPSFFCKKYVGKTHYKEPKVFGKKQQFMANKADIWSLGVCLFMMIIGAPPYNKPYSKDPGFRFIENQKMTKLLYSWGRIKYVTPNLYDLMERMLCCDETKRISMDEIVEHKWLKIYFPKKEKTRKQTVSSPLSPSLSTHPSASFNSVSRHSMNRMVPQQAVSASITNNNSSSNISIIESRTNDQLPSEYYAMVEREHEFIDFEEKNDSMKDEKKMKKKKTKKFKLSFSIFGSSKNVK